MLTILNDTHIGVERSAGTTLQTKAALKLRVRQEFARLLPDTDLMLLGDIFDSHQVSAADVLETYRSLVNWLRNGHFLYLVAGNHDLSKTSNVLGSFDLLSELLKDASDSVVVIKVPQMTPYGYVIPHLPSQKLFDEALEQVPECDYLYLHVNYDNKFAAKSDQSLNISVEQVAGCKAGQIIIAHEHQTKDSGKVLLPGNQIPTSVSDWIGCSAKYKTVVGHGLVTKIEVASSIGQFAEIDWTALAPVDCPFIRVVGSASAEQANQVVNAIAKYRETSPALVISNAVEIEQNDGLGDFQGSLEAVQAFDVWRALGEVLEPAEITKLQELT